jgi:hypothetical protein
MKFRTPLTIEPSDCRLSAKLGRIKINGKEHPFEMGVKTDFSVYLVGGLDAQGNCEVGTVDTWPGGIGVIRGGYQTGMGQN